MLNLKELDNVKASKFKEIKCPKCDTLINEEDYIFGFRRSSRYRQRAEVSFGN